MLDAATRAFTDALGAAATIGAALLIATAAATAVVLRRLPATAGVSAEDAPLPVAALVPKPA